MRTATILAIGAAGTIAAIPTAVVAAMAVAETAPEPPPVTGTVDAVFFRIGDPGWCSILVATPDGDVWADVDDGDHRTFCDTVTRGDRVQVTASTVAFAYSASVDIGEPEPDG